MRVAVVAGPDPGHAFPAMALCLRLQAAGDEPVLFTSPRWQDAAARAGVPWRRLPGLAPRPGDDDADPGQRMHGRAAYMSTVLVPELHALRPDLVVGDVLTAAGGLAAERLGLPWVELCPHPLYLPSCGLPPVGSGLAVGTGVGGRARDSLLRAMAARSTRKGQRQRAAARASVGLPVRDPGPTARLVATLPALEVPRPDWPEGTHVVGPLQWDPQEAELALPPGADPLVFLSPSTAEGGTLGVLEAALAGLSGVRVVATVLDPDPALEVPGWASVGTGRQDTLLAAASVAVIGGGHGMLAKALAAGVPTVLVPGGGDQWELANRAARQGSAVIVRPLTPERLAAAVQQVLAEPTHAAAAQRAARSLDEVRADAVTVCREAAACGR
ncbi:nucleotide disphospho-sugar-binding domain-containing protein [Rhodococcus sp. X156]|uniref:glycosyltransferase n=1 Tax=Rhodococcus sp. X156 TaxID=2499145 RepID=UPI000FD728F6|nr:nucleotide disphospho-sugar-binding domain-containing protein [Rhodococcus sp. X156]